MKWNRVGMKEEKEKESCGKMLRASYHVRIASKRTLPSYAQSSVRFGAELRD
jgi:predicted DNA-binding protein (MmcQ/YjbR family)